MLASWSDDAANEREQKKRRGLFLRIGSGLAVYLNQNGYHDTTLCVRHAKQMPTWRIAETSTITMRTYQETHPRMCEFCRK